jgi:hypothetical protein
MVYLSLDEGEAIVTLCADIACEARVRSVAATPVFGDSITRATDGSIMAYYMREDEQTEILGQGDLVILADNAQFQAQNIVQSIVLIPSTGMSNVRMDRSASSGTYQGWGYLRRAGASSRTQMRLGDGTITVSGNTAIYSALEANHTHTICAGDTLVVGVYARTITSANATVFGLDASIPGGIAPSNFAWIPLDGERIVHLFMRQSAISANISLRVGGTNMTSTTGSYGSSGSLFGTYTGKLIPRYVDAKDVLHVRVRSGYRQVLSGYPVPGRDSVASGSPPLVCAQSISSAAPGVSSTQSFQGFSMRIEPPQNNLYRFMNV